MDDWRLLSDCLPAWLSTETEKDAGTEAPASEGPRQAGGECLGVANRDRMNAALPMGRNMNLAPTTRSPGAAKFIFLVIDNEGDAPAWSEGGRAPGRLRIKPRRDRASELGWVVVEGGRSHATAPEVGSPAASLHV